VNIRFKQIVPRVAAATGVLVGSLVVGCSSTTNGNPLPGPNTSGTSNSTSGSGNTGGTSAGTGGASGGASAGTGGAGKCPGNQVTMAGACTCPAYAPTYCEAITKCVSSMKDPDHCGDCITKCGAMNACAAGKCTPDLASFAEITGCGTLELLTAPDKSKLYALSTMMGTLSSIALPTGGAATSVAIGLTGGTAFAVDATYAYVATGKTVTQVKLADGTKTVLVTEMDTIWDVAVDAGKIYYATGKNIMQASATTPGVGASVAVSADEGVAEGLAVSAGTVLYASAAAFNLESALIAGNGHVKIGASQAGLIFGHRSVQADTMNVYWSNGGLQSAPFTGTEHPATTVASPIDGKPITAYAVDSATTTAYIATLDDPMTMTGSLEKSKFSDGGSDAAWMARALPKVSSIVLDDTSVYVASACKIFKSAR
jgi:hypothetical protein